MSHLISPGSLLAAVDVGGVVMTAIGLGALIFFHELGHFLACRLTNTRVEAFSIGFGPELFGWTRGTTRYRIAAIPLGGYVKMAAENPGEARTDAPDEFPNKSFSQRLFIMSNGVLFNVILAFVLFVGAFGLGVSFESPEVGAVEPGGPAWDAGVREGDVVEEVDGARILTFTDIKTEIAFSDADETLDFTVRRDTGERERVTVKPRYSEAAGMPVIGIGPALEPGLGVAEDSAFARAGGRDGDVPIAVNGRPLAEPAELVPELQRIAGRAAPNAESVPVRLRVRRDGAEEEIAVDLPLVRRQVGIVPYGGRTPSSVGAELRGQIRPGDEVVRAGGEPLPDLTLLRDLPDRTVARVTVQRAGQTAVVPLPRPMTLRELARALPVEQDTDVTRVTPRPGLAADRAGIVPGDRVKSVGGREVRTWSDLQEAVEASDGDELSVVVERDGETKELALTPGRFPDLGALGIAQRIKTTMYQETGLVPVLSLGWRRTVLFMKQVTLTIRSLVTRRVSAKHIGGPIALAQVTYQMFDFGFGRYLYILAIISINLAVLNLLPIPVLDGGQIVLLCAEKIRGKPLPDRVVGYLQLLGLFLILALIVLAFSNDIGRLLGGS